MGHHDNRFPLICQLLKYLKNGFSRIRIQVSSRLIRNDQWRIVYQGSRDRDPLFLTARDMRRDFISMFYDFYQLKQFECSLFTGNRMVSPGEILREHDILHQIETGHQLKGLIHNPNVAPSPCRF